MPTTCPPQQSSDWKPKTQTDPKRLYSHWQQLRVYILYLEFIYLIFNRSVRVCVRRTCCGCGLSTFTLVVHLQLIQLEDVLGLARVRCRASLTVVLQSVQSVCDLPARQVFTPCKCRPPALCVFTAQRWFSLRLPWRRMFARSEPEPGISLSVFRLEAPTLD